MAKTQPQPKSPASPSKLYWTGTTFIPGIGHVSGEAKEEDVAEFDAQTAHVETLVRENYLSTKPPAPAKDKKPIDA